MGAPIKDMTPAEDPSAEALLTTLRTIEPAERRKHASVFNYWLSIRGKREFPTIRDLDPLEISDAGPFSLLMEMIGGGEDAEIRHLGHAIKMGVEAQRLSDVDAPSLLACIHAKLPVVAASRQAFAFEDRFDTPEGKRRCWVTLLPLSASGTWIDFVYGFVSLEGVHAETDAEPRDSAATAEDAPGAAADVVDVVEDEAGVAADVAEAPPSSADEAADAFRVNLGPLDDGEMVEPVAEEPGPEPEPVAEVEPEPAPEPIATVEPDEESVAVHEPEPAFEPEPEPDDPPQQDYRPRAEAGFSSKLLAGLASVGGFYGKVIQSQPAEPEPEPDPEPEFEPEPEFAPEAEAIAPVEEVYAEPEPEPEPEPEAAQVAEPEPESQPESQPEPQQASVPPVAMEANLQDKLSGVRAMAEEARAAQERSNMALYEGLSAAYDFALDAEQQPEDYLRLVEAQGLKIQLRSPMKPVVKLAFAGLTDDVTIGQLEAVLAWALKSDLARGTLAERIVAEGGIGQILNSKPH